MKFLNSLWIKSIAAFLILILILQEPLLATGEVPSAFPILSSQSQLPNQLFNTLPRKWGKIQKVFKGSSPLFLIHVQDAHLNLEAQQNIARTIHYFVNHTGLNRIYLEGATGELSHQPLSVFPDPKAKTLVADAFLRQGFLTGPEYAAIAKHPELALYGVEDPALYEKNRQAFLEAVEFQRKDKPQLEIFEKQAEMLIRFVFPERLKKIYKERTSFQKNPSGLSRYAEFLFQEASALSLTQNYPQLSKLHELQQLKDQAAQKTAALKIGEDLSIDLFKEIQDLEKTLFEKLAETREQKELMKIFNGLEIIGRLMDFSMTHEDAEAYYSTPQDFDLASLYQALVRVSENYPAVPKMKAIASQNLKADLKYFEKFYQLALQRDGLLVEKTLADMKRRRVSTAVLVTGGFHTPKLEAYLEKEGISYCVITPSLAKLDPHEKDLYVEAMRSKRTQFFQRLQEVVQYQKTVANDPRFQLQAPHRLPPLRLLQQIRNQPVLPLPQLVEKYPALDFMVYAMLLLSGKSADLGSLSPATWPAIEKKLRPAEQKLAAQIYQPMGQAAIRHQGKSSALLADYFSEQGFAVEIKTEPKKAASEVGAHTREVSLTTSDGKTTTLQLLREKIQYQNVQKKWNPISGKSKRSEVRQESVVQEKPLQETPSQKEQTILLERPVRAQENPPASSILAKGFQWVNGTLAAFVTLGFLMMEILPGHLSSDKLLMLLSQAFTFALGCGIFWVSLKRLSNESDEVYLERILTILERLANFMSLFGSHGIGAAIQVEYPDGRIDYIHFKMPNGYGQTAFLYKRVGRTELVKQFMDEFRQRIDYVRSKGAKLRRTHVSLAGHVRLKTSGGKLLVETTQPFYINPGYKIRKWRKVEGQMQVREEYNIAYSAANGDTQKARLPGRIGGIFFDANAADSPWGKFFERAFGIKIGDNDSEEAAYFMYFLTTQGSLADSLRLAYVSQFFQSVDDDVPSLSKLQKWENALEPLVQEYGMLDWSQPAMMKKLLDEAEKLLPRDRAVPTASGEDYRMFLEIALKAFQENDAKKAAQTFMSMVNEHSTFGLFYESSLEPDVRVVISREQPVSIVENVDNGVQLGGSNFDFIKWALRSGDPYFRQGQKTRIMTLRMDKDLPEQGGEIGEINFSADAVNIYSMNHARDLSEREIQARWREITHEPPAWQTPKLDDYPMLNDLKISQAVAEALHLEAQTESPETSETLKAWKKFADRWAEGALQFEKIHQVLQGHGIDTPVKHGAPDLHIVVFREENIVIGNWFRDLMKLRYPLANIEVTNANDYIRAVENHPLYINTNTFFFGDHFPQERIAEEHARRVKMDGGEIEHKMSREKQEIKNKDTEATWKVLELFHDRKPPHAFVFTPTSENNVSRSLGHDYVNVISTKYFPEVDGSTGAAWSQIISLLELDKYLARDMRRRFPRGAPFGMTLSNRDLSGLEANFEFMVTKGLNEILGLTHDQNGKLVETKTKIHEDLLGLSRRLERYFTEQARATALTVGHLFLTVGFTSTIFQIAIGILLIGLGGVGTMPAIVLSFFTHIIFDFPLYLWFKYMAVRFLRAQEKREALYRDGNPSVVLGDSQWSRLQRAFFSKMFGLAKAVVSPQAIYYADQFADLEGKHGHDARRGTMIFLSVVSEMIWNDFVNAGHEGSALIKNQAESFASIDAVGPMLIGIVDDPHPEKFKFTEYVSVYSEQRARLQQKEMFDNLPVSGKILELAVNGPLRMMAQQVVLVEIVKEMQKLRVGFPVQWQTEANQNASKATTTAPIRPPKSIWDKGRIIVGRTRDFLGTPLEEALEPDLVFSRSEEDKKNPLAASGNGHSKSNGHESASEPHKKETPSANAHAKKNGNAVHTGNGDTARGSNGNAVLHSNGKTIRIKKSWGYVEKPHSDDDEKETVGTGRSEVRAFPKKTKLGGEKLEGREVLNGDAAAALFTIHESPFHASDLVPEVSLPATDAFFDQIADHPVLSGNAKAFLEGDRVVQINLTYVEGEKTVNRTLSEIKVRGNSPYSFTWIEKASSKTEPPTILKVRFLEDDPTHAVVLNQRTGVSTGFEFEYPEKTTGFFNGVLKRVVITDENHHVVTVNVENTVTESIETESDEPEKAAEEVMETPSNSNSSGSNSSDTGSAEQNFVPVSTEPKKIVTGGNTTGAENFGISPKDLLKLMGEETTESEAQNEEKVKTETSTVEVPTVFVATQAASEAGENEKTSTAVELKASAETVQPVISQTSELKTVTATPANAASQSADLSPLTEKGIHGAAFVAGAALAGNALYEASKKEKRQTMFYWFGLSILLGGGALLIFSLFSLAYSITFAALALGLVSFAYWIEQKIKSESVSKTFALIPSPQPVSQVETVPDQVVKEEDAETFHEEALAPTVSLNHDATVLTLDFSPHPEADHLRDPKGEKILKLLFHEDGEGYQAGGGLMVAVADPHTNQIEFKSNANGDGYHLYPDQVPHFGLNADPSLIKRMNDRITRQNQVLESTTEVSSPAISQIESRAAPTPHSFSLPWKTYVQTAKKIGLALAAATAAFVLWKFLPTLPSIETQELWTQAQTLLKTPQLTEISYWSGLMGGTFYILRLLSRYFSSLFPKQKIGLGIVVLGVVILLGGLPLLKGWATIYFMNQVVWLVIGGLATGLLGPLFFSKIFSKIMAVMFAGDSNLHHGVRNFITGLATLIVMVALSIGNYMLFFSGLDKSQDTKQMLENMTQYIKPHADWTPPAPVIPTQKSEENHTHAEAGVIPQPKKMEFKNLNPLLFEADPTGISVPIRALKEGHIELDPESGISLEDWLNPDKAIKVVGGQPLFRLKRATTETGAAGRQRVAGFKKYVYDRLQEGDLYRKDAKGAQPLRNQKLKLYDKAGFLMRQIDNYESAQAVDVYSRIFVSLPPGEEGWILPGIRRLGTVNEDTTLCLLRSVYENVVKTEIPMKDWESGDSLGAQIKAGLSGQTLQPAQSIVLMVEPRVDGKFLVTEGLSSRKSGIKIFDWDLKNNRPMPVDLEITPSPFPEKASYAPYLSAPLASPYVTLGKREMVAIHPTNEDGRTKFNKPEASWVAPSAKPSQQKQEKNLAAGTTLRERLFPYQSQNFETNPDAVAEIQASDRARLKALSAEIQEFEKELRAFAVELDKQIAENRVPFAPEEIEDFADFVVRFRETAAIADLQYYKPTAAGILTQSYLSRGQATAKGTPIAYVSTRRISTTFDISKNIPVQPGDILILEDVAQKNKWMPVRVRNVAVAGNQEQGESQAHMQQITIDSLDIPVPVTLSIEAQTPSGQKIAIPFEFPAMRLAEAQFGVRLHVQPSEDQGILQELYRKREEAAAKIFASENIASLPPLPGIFQYVEPVRDEDKSILITLMEKAKTLSQKNDSAISQTATLPEETPIEKNTTFPKDFPEERKRLFTDPNPNGQRKAMRDFLAASGMPEDQKIAFIKNRILLNANSDIAQMGMDYLLQERNIKELLDVHALLTEKAPNHPLTKRARWYVIELIESGSASLLTGPADNLLENLTLETDLSQGRKFAASVLTAENAAFHWRYSVAVRRILESKFWKTYQAQFQLAAGLENLKTEDPLLQERGRKAAHLVRSYIFARMLEHSSFEHSESIEHAKETGPVKRLDPREWLRLHHIDRSEELDREFTHSPSALSYDDPLVYFKDLVNSKVYETVRSEYEKEKAESEKTVAPVEVYDFSAQPDGWIQDFIFPRLDPTSKRGYIENNLSNPALGVKNFRALQRLLPLMDSPKNEEEEKDREIAMNQLIKAINNPEAQYLLALTIITTENPAVIQHLMNGGVDTLLMRRLLELTHGEKDKDPDVLWSIQYALAKLARNGRSGIFHPLFDSFDSRELKLIVDGRHWINRLFPDEAKTFLQGFALEKISKKVILFSSEKVAERRGLPKHDDAEHHSSAGSYHKNLEMALEPHGHDVQEIKTVLQQESETPKGWFSIFDVKDSTLVAFSTELGHAADLKPSERIFVGFYEASRLLIASLGIAFAVSIGFVLGVIKRINFSSRSSSSGWLSRFFVAGFLALPLFVEKKAEAEFIPEAQVKTETIPPVILKPSETSTAPRAEVRRSATAQKAPKGLVTALAAKDKMQREAQLQEMIPFEAFEKKARQEGWELLQALRSFGELDYYQNKTQDYANHGEIILVYGQEHDIAFMRQFFKQIKNQRKVRQINILRRVGVSEQKWQAVQAQVKAFNLGENTRLVFHDGIGSGVLNRLVIDRTRALGISLGHVMQLSDPSRTQPDQIKYYESLMMGAVPLAKATLIILGNDEVLPQIEELKIPEIIKQIFIAQKAVAVSA